MPKTSPKQVSTKKALTVLAFLIAIPVIVVLVIQAAVKPYWQKEIDQRLSSLTTEAEKKQLVVEYFAAALAPDADHYIVNPDNQASTAIMRYNYIAEKAWYKCEQTHEYSDTAPSASFVVCYKR